MRYSGVMIIIICSILMILIFCVAPISASTVDTYLSDDIIDYANEISDEYGLCPEFVMAVIEAESGGNKKCKSSYGAVGLMQVVPKWNKDRIKRLGVTDLYDPYSNILVGVDLLAELFEKYEEPYIVLMTYNEGEYGGAVERAEAGKFSEYAKKIMKRSEELERVHGK